MHIALAQQLHQAPGGIRLMRRQQQMHMIRHQDVGMNRASGALRALLQLVEVISVVDIRKEAGLAVVAALDDVQGNVGEGDACAARHRLTLGK